MRKSWRLFFIFLLLFMAQFALANSPQKISIVLTDSTRLATYIYRPANSDSTALPTIFVRSKSDFQRYEKAADYFVQNGYNFIVQLTRGNGESTGKESFFLADGPGEFQDGVESLNWIAAQPWSNGKIGAFGMDIDGFLAHLLAATGHRNLKALYTLAAPYNFYRDVAFPGGAYRENFLEKWTEQIDSNFLLHTFELTPYASSFWKPLNIRINCVNGAMPAVHVVG